MNHGGRAASLTTPNPKQQAEVIKAAYKKAGIDPKTVSYIEAHGTGTELGDPVEINGLKQAFSSFADGKEKAAKLLRLRVGQNEYRPFIPCRGSSGHY
ncbi:hypothetical protein ACSE3M_20960 [Bacillus velezensis]